jgi:endonuclease-3
MLIARLKRHCGKPEVPPARGPFELVMWENACYLLPDERRLEVFEALRDKVGLGAASDRLPLPTRFSCRLAKRGGMRPETRVFRWREIARITMKQYGGDLDSILKLPYAEAKKALKQFPTIGDPGGGEDPAPVRSRLRPYRMESNGLRVLVRVGWGRSQKKLWSYLPFRPDRSPAGAARGRVTPHRSSSPVAAAWKGNLQRQGAPMPSVPCF